LVNPIEFNGKIGRPPARKAKPSEGKGALEKARPFRVQTVQTHRNEK